MRRGIRPAKVRRASAETLGMMSWFQALMPREDRFFDLFAQHSRTLVAGAEALNSLLHEGGAAVPHFCDVIMARENEADQITREVLIAVRRTFITPFDRGDIKNLITSMDDAIDQMQKTAKAITLFEVTQFEPQMKAMGGSVVECAGLIAEAIPLLEQLNRHVVRLSNIAEKVSRIEGEADELHDNGLKELFRRHTDNNEMDFIVGSTIYDHLEAVVDRFDDISNEINSVVIEHV
jgi:uncharacterized protein